ncbi:hypothetical protein ACFLIM_05490 [Nonomuraea sp. M3C6]|uniref:Uncharacterized protein n=1 Tax=Nonomuraea marmarensis TaxID=3351344 RepID=A0ABW7A6I9_9ACTN
MDAADLTGAYTYRSFLDLPDPVDDFNRLRFGQLELRLSAEPDGTLSGLLLFPAPPGAEPQRMDITGKVSAEAPLQFHFTGKGRPGTAIADFHYEYDGTVLRGWEAGIGQRMTLAGTVLRAADHGSRAGLARAGQTASFLAVRRGP